MDHHLFCDVVRREYSWAATESPKNPQCKPVNNCGGGRDFPESLVSSLKRWQPATECAAHLLQMDLNDLSRRSSLQLIEQVGHELRRFNQAIKEFDHGIKELFKSHPDHFLFESLPGAGEKLAPRLLSLFGSDRSRWPDAADTHAGRPTSLMMKLFMFKPLKNGIFPFPPIDGPPQTLEGTRRSWGVGRLSRRWCLEPIVSHHSEIQWKAL
jgi:hypothetical protein